MGVVNLHTGPGLAAAMPMLCNARLDQVPLLVTAGQQDSRLLMQEPSLADDLVGMASHFVKWSTEVLYASDLAMVIHRAFKVATHPPCGPVFVSLPQDVLDQRIDFEIFAGQSFTRLRPDREAIRKSAEILTEAKSPVVLVDNGVARSEALAEAVELAELIGAAVYDPWMSDVNFPVGHPQYLET